jgi:hypothetical protein
MRGTRRRFEVGRAIPVAGKEGICQRPRAYRRLRRISGSFERLKGTERKRTERREWRNLAKR